LSHTGIWSLAFLLLLTSILPYAPASAQTSQAGLVIMDKFIDSANQMFLRHRFFQNGTIAVSDGLGASLVIGSLELSYAHKTELID